MPHGLERFDAAGLAALLSARLQQPLPGVRGHRLMAPDLAYGRHSVPAPADARRAAVLALLYPIEAGWSLVMTLRTSSLGNHAGQVSFPGGMIDAGESAAAAALREYEEELGADTAAVTLVGELSPVFLFVSNFAIQPFVAIASVPPVFRPNPDEVAEVVELPLAVLADSRCQAAYRVERQGLVFDAPCYIVNGRVIWGATAIIIAELVETLRDVAGRAFPAAATL